MFGKLAGPMKRILQLTMLWLLASGLLPLWRLDAQELAVSKTPKAGADRAWLEREVSRGGD